MKLSEIQPNILELLKRMNSLKTHVLKLNSEITKANLLIEKTVTTETSTMHIFNDQVDDAEIIVTGVFRLEQELITNVLGLYLNLTKENLASVIAEYQKHELSLRAIMQKATIELNEFESNQ